MAQIRYHLDENIPPAVADGLRRRGIDVTTTNEASLTGAGDPDQLGHALTESRVLVSQDADMLRLNASGVSHAGIAYCHPQSRSVGEMIRGLVLIWELLEAEDMV